ncbi:MAG: hypothetical protein UIB61_04885 [Treponema sp.]|nr:hypothetical protein [Treponema sp.]
MNNKNINKITKVVSKFFEILFFLSFLVMIAAAVLSFTMPQKFGEFLLESVGNGTIATNGFEIAIADKNGNLISAAVKIFVFAGIFTMPCMAMIFRNIYLIIKTCEGKTWFSKGKTPFQKDVVRMVREIGIFSIMIPVIGFIMSLIARIFIGVDSCETSVQIVGVAMGIAMICFSEIFAYGIKLEEEVEGLV